MENYVSLILSVMALIIGVLALIVAVQARRQTDALADRVSETELGFPREASPDGPEAWRRQVL